MILSASALIFALALQPAKTGDYCVYDAAASKLLVTATPVEAVTPSAAPAKMISFQGERYERYAEAGSQTGAVKTGQLAYVGKYRDLPVLQQPGESLAIYVLTEAQDCILQAYLREGTTAR